MWKRMWLVSTIASAVIGCVGGPETRTGACAVFKPVRPTVADIEAASTILVEQILVHNETGARLCGWKATSDRYAIPDEA